MEKVFRFLEIEELPEDCRKAIIDDDFKRNNVADGIYSDAVEVFGGGFALVGFDSEGRLFGVQSLSAELTDQQVWDILFPT